MRVDNPVRAGVGVCERCRCPEVERVRYPYEVEVPDWTGVQGTKWVTLTENICEDCYREVNENAGPLSG